MDISTIIYTPEHNQPHFLKTIRELEDALNSFDRFEVIDIFMRKVSSVLTTSGSDAHIGYFFEFQRLGQIYLNLVFFPIYEDTTYQLRENVEDKEYNTLKSKETVFPDYRRIQINEIRFENHPLANHNQRPSNL